MFRTAELDMSAGCVTERVFMLCSFPVMVAVVQQSVGKMGRCSLDDRIRVPKATEALAERRNYGILQKGVVQAINFFFS